MITKFVSLNSAVTNFVLGGVLRSIFSAVAGVVSEVWNDLVQTKRKLFLDTATGADLDQLAARRGLTRLGATGSSAVLVFTGTAGTIIPLGTQVKSQSNGIVFATSAQITIAAKNAALGGAATSEALGDSVVAESTTTGAVTNVPAQSVNALVNPIAGVTGVSNPAPAQGGADAEADDFFAARIRDQVSLLSQGTQAFYEALAKAANPAVLRAKAIWDSSTRGIKVIVLKANGGTFSAPELSAIETYIADNGRSADTVTCVNVTFTNLAISFGTTFNSGWDENTALPPIADLIAEFIDWRRWEFGGDVLIDDMIAIVKSHASIANLDTANFKINGGVSDVAVPDDELPYFASLTILNTTYSTQATASLSVQYSA